MTHGFRTVLLIDDEAISSVEQTDLTGDGVPELIVQQFSGGPHCCFALSVFTRTPTLRTLLRWDRGNYDAWDTEDLDGDGRPEIVGHYDGFACYDYSFAASPSVPLVLRYDGRRFVEATKRYPKLLRKGLDAARNELLKGRKKGEREIWWNERYRSLLTALYADALLLGTGRQEYAWVQANRPPEERAWLEAHRADIARVLRKRAERISYHRRQRL